MQATYIIKKILIVPHECSKNFQTMSILLLNFRNFSDLNEGNKVDVSNKAEPRVNFPNLEKINLMSWLII